LILIRFSQVIKSMSPSHIVQLMLTPHRKSREWERSIQKNKKEIL